MMKRRLRTFRYATAVAVFGTIPFSNSLAAQEADDAPEENRTIEDSGARADGAPENDSKAVQVVSGAIDLQTTTNTNTSPKSDMVLIGQMPSSDRPTGEDGECVGYVSDPDSWAKDPRNAQVSGNPDGLLYHPCEQVTQFDGGPGLFNDAVVVPNIDPASYHAEKQKVALARGEYYPATYVAKPCDAVTKSLLMEGRGWPLLESNDCEPRVGTAGVPIATRASFETLASWIAQQERDYISALQSDPSKVIDLTDVFARTALVANNMQVSYAQMEGFVLGQLIAVMLKPASERSSTERTVADWAIRSYISLGRNLDRESFRLYRQFMRSECSFVPPFGADEFKKEHQISANCSGVPVLVGSFTKTAGKVPSYDTVRRWAAYNIANDLVARGNRSIDAAAISLDAALISSAAIASTSLAAGMAVGGITVINIGSLLPYSAGGAVAAKMAFSGISSTAAIASVSAAGTIAGATAVASAATVGVVGAAMIGIAIAILVEDEKYHNRMGGLASTGYMSPSTAEKRLREELENGDPQSLLFILSDVMGGEHASSLLPGRLQLPIVSPVQAPSAGSVAGISGAYGKTAASTANPLFAAPKLPEVSAAWTRDNGNTYVFFSDGTYWRSSPGEGAGVDEGYPKNFSHTDIALPKTWDGKLDAFFRLNGSNISYVFEDGEYIRLNGVGRERGFPRSFPGGWRGMPESWGGQVDAAFYFPEWKKHYFFRGNEYIRLTGTTVDPGYPAELPGGWVGMPKHFQSGIDAATYRGGHTYMVKGDEYIRFTGTKMDAGYPKFMSSWPE